MLSGLIVYTLCGLCMFGVCMIFGAMKEFEEFIKEDRSLTKNEIALMFITFMFLLWLLWPIFVIDIAMDIYNDFRK